MGENEKFLSKVKGLGPKMR